MSILSEKAEKIMAFINDENYSPMRIKDMAFILEVPADDQQLFSDTIEHLIKSGKIITTKKGKIITPTSVKLLSGIFSGHPRGFGFVTPDENGGGDIFVPAAYVNGAMHKDKVLYRIISPNHNGNGKRTEGEIVKIIEKGFSSIVGTFERRKNYCYVIPDEKKIPYEIIINEGNTNAAVSGHKVVVTLQKAPAEGHSPEGHSPERLSPVGRVTEILGHINDPGVDVLSIVRMYGLPVEYPKNVLEEALSLPTEVTECDLIGRRDLRDQMMITIDGEDTKDIDDAVSLSMSGDNYLLGVHIADVTHYVKENYALDKEALKRGTSVYLADRVIPMLPHLLSNGICSLNAGTDRLALSCVMEIDLQGHLINHDIFISVIRVDRRMTYNLVNDLLTDEHSRMLPEYAELMPMLNHMRELATILRSKRIKRGAIEFDLPEAKIIVDEKGFPIDIKTYDRNIATSIIEEFMLMCNETIAEEYFYRELPFVYRTHEDPDTEKMQSLTEFIRHFGYHIKGKSSHPKAVQELLTRIEGTPEELIISRIILRSMKQARYTPENEGHFGLAAKYYCHFTSPIRRYPDLQIHRIIKETLNGLSDDRIQHYENILESVCIRCSAAERKAEETEREVDNLKKVQYMMDKIGQSFDGIISGVTSWGIFVALPNTVEGMVSLDNMNDDHYVFFEDRMMYIGERTKKTYSLGQAVRVSLIRADEQIRRLDFVFFDE